MSHKSMHQGGAEPWTWTPLRDRVAEQIAAEIEAERKNYIAPVDYPIGHKLVLLKLRRSELANQLLDRLFEQGQYQNVPSDWNEMREAGLVNRIDGKLRLTPRGLDHAQDIARDLAQKFGIHRTEFQPAIPHTSFGHAGKCTCGWSTFGPNSWNGKSRVMREIGDHEQQVRDGTLPPAWRIGPTLGGGTAQPAAGEPNALSAMDSSTAAIPDAGRVE